MTEEQKPAGDAPAQTDLVDHLNESVDGTPAPTPPDKPTSKENLEALRQEKAAADNEAAAKAAAQKKAAARRAKPRVAKLQVKVAGADKATIRCLAEINANLGNLAREGRRLEGIGPELAALLKLLPRVRKELKNAA